MANRASVLIPLETKEKLKKLVEYYQEENELRVTQPFVINQLVEEKLKEFEDKKGKKM